MVDIEASSVSFLENRLSFIERIKTFFNQRDTQPIWDGNIYVYKNNDKKKDNLLKAIPVQIKGDTTQSIKKNTIYYSADVADLKGFLTEDGTIYFVIGMDVQNRKNKIYYNCLLPIKIHKLLENIPEIQKTRKIQLKALPEEDEKILEIFLNFIRDSNKQGNVREIGIMSLTELQSKKEVHHIEFGRVTTQKVPSISDMLGQEFCIYAVNAVGVSYPLQEGILTEIKKEIPQKITCGDKVYYDKIEISQTSDSFTILLGKSLSITYTKPQKGKYNEIKIEFDARGTIKERLHDIDFFIALKERQDIYTDDKLSIKLPNDFDIQVDSNTIKKHKKYLEMIAQAMECAGLPDDSLSFEELNKNNAALANILIRAFVKKEAVNLNPSPQDEVSFGILAIEQVKLIILAKKIENNACRIENFFTANLNINIGTLENIEYPSSRYAFLKEEHFLAGCNINYENLYNDITRVKISPYHINRVTMLLLEMLRAYDKNKSDKLLEASERLAIWLMENKLEGSENIAIINLIQIKQRKGTIDEQDKEQILNILTSDVNEQIKAACYILSELPKKARETINAMDEETKNIFINYPICNLLDKKSLEKLAK